MREHLGVDVDALDEDDLMIHEPVQSEHIQKPWDPEQEQQYGRDEGITQVKQHTAVDTLITAGVENIKEGFRLLSVNDKLLTHHAILIAGAGAKEDVATTFAKELHKAGQGHVTRDSNIGDATLEAERKDFTTEGRERTGFASSEVPTVEEKSIAENRPPSSQVDTASKIEPSETAPLCQSNSDEAVKDPRYAEALEVTKKED